MGDNVQQIKLVYATYIRLKPAKEQIEYVWTDGHRKNK